MSELLVPIQTEACQESSEEYSVTEDTQMEVQISLLLSL